MTATMPGFRVDGRAVEHVVGGAHAPLLRGGVAEAEEGHERNLSASGKAGGGRGRKRRGAHCVRRGDRRCGGPVGGDAESSPVLPPLRIRVPGRNSRAPCVESRDGHHYLRGGRSSHVPGHVVSPPRVRFGVPSLEVARELRPRHRAGDLRGGRAGPGQRGRLHRRPPHGLAADPGGAAGAHPRPPARRRAPDRRAARRRGAAGDADGRRRQDRARPAGRLADRRARRRRPGPARAPRRRPGSRRGRGPDARWCAR